MVKDVTPRPLNDEQSSMQTLKQYAGYIIMAMILALAGYFGWTYWQNHGGRIDQAAANDFAKLQNDQTNLDNLATDADKTKLTAAQATFITDLDSFIAKHGDSVYTWQALMLKAKQQTDSNDTKGAVTTLQRATQLKLEDAGLSALATLRYAQALLANNQADEAQKTLQANLPSAFDASKEELLGDIAMAKNDKKAATAHYQKAWQAIEARNQASQVKKDRALLRLKMENLGLTPKQPDLSGGVITQPTPNISMAPDAQGNTASAVAANNSSATASAGATNQAASTTK